MLKFCKNCCMDGTAIELVLDENGVCNFCHQAQRELASIGDTRELLKVYDQIVKDGQGKKYDCLIGLSGGVDSSTVLHTAVKLGLRPLCFSIDNGYNDPKADENIMRMVEKLQVPFYRYTIDLKKFTELQGAFIKAGVPNIEIPTDHVLMAATYEMAAKYGIKWILSGGNVASESIMPASWGYNARDLVHIKAIYKQFTGKKLTGLPTCSLLKWNYYKWIKGIKTFYLLDYVEYNLDKAKQTLKEQYGWQDYYAKHCENLFTWWFQAYYLFEKFGIDKRKPHYSSLINSGQMTRDKAKELLGEKLEYPDLGWKLNYLATSSPKRKHEDYPMDRWYERIAKIVKLFK